MSKSSDCQIISCEQRAYSDVAIRVLQRIAVQRTVADACTAIAGLVDEDQGTLLSYLLEQLKLRGVSIELFTCVLEEFMSRGEQVSIPAYGPCQDVDGFTQH